MRRKSDDTSPMFISFPNLAKRWGVSKMKLERLQREDPDFPDIHRFGPKGRYKFCRITQVEVYERASVRGAHG